MLKKYLWKKAIKKACSATEGLEDTFANYLTKSPGVKRYFRLLTKANTSNNLYRNFVITIAFELYMCKRKEQKAWSLAFAILDNWFDLNKVDYPMRRKTPCFSYGDIRRVHRIYASN